MFKRRLVPFLGLLLVTCVAVNGQNRETFITGSAKDAITSPMGGICLMGGATENDEAMRWFLRRADGGDVVVLRASGSDGYNNYFYEELGVQINSVTSIVFHTREASFDPFVIEKISKAEAVWFAGGDQSKYVAYWRDSPVDSTINARLASGMVIGGTSAGMAILGGHYFSAKNGTITSEEALANPLDSRITIESEPFFSIPILSQVITDTHFDDPDRSGRLVAFMANAQNRYSIEPFAIACEEYTSVCIDIKGNARVFGLYPKEQDYAYFLSLNCLIENQIPEIFSATEPLTWNRNGQIIQALKIPGTPDGNQSFNINRWIESNDGTWEYWHVENGRLIKTPGSKRRCELVTGSLNPNSSEVYVFPNPSDNHTVKIKGTSSIEEISAFTQNGAQVSFQERFLDLNEVELTFETSNRIICLDIETSTGHISKIVINE